jgi:plasmid maintenance system antidote protein VapI
MTMTEQLRRCIDAAGISRYAICKAVGLPESTMSRFMAGKCGLSLATVDRLGELLGLEIITRGQARKTKGRAP